MLEKIKSLFFVEENDPKSLKTKEKAITKRIQKNENTPPVKGGEVTSKFSNILMTAMAKKNLEGFDYLEFKQSLQSLSNMQMDEATQYKSAFAMAKTMKVTKKKLLDAASYYLKVLENENRKFYEALKNQKQRLIGKTSIRKNRWRQLLRKMKKRFKSCRKKLKNLKNSKRR